MSAGNAPEQLEEALVESVISAALQAHGAKEVKRTYTVDEHGNLVIDSYLVKPQTVDKIVVYVRDL